MRVLMIEDGLKRSDVLGGLLRARGHQPLRAATDGEPPHREADIVVFNLDAPNNHWLNTLRRLRLTSQVPVLVWAARRDEYPAVRWVRGGADDYLGKPARSDELITRIENLRRRPAPTGATARELVRTGRTAIDLKGRAVRVDGAAVELTEIEFDILAALARHQGKPVSRQMIVADVWGNRPRPSSRSLDSHMANLRAKLAQPGLVQTLYGFGYRLG